MNTLNKGFSEDMKKKNPNEIKFYFTFHNKFFFWTEDNPKHSVYSARCCFHQLVHIRT